MWMDSLLYMFRIIALNSITVSVTPTQKRTKSEANKDEETSVDQNNHIYKEKQESLQRNIISFPVPPITSIVHQIITINILPKIVQNQH